MSMQIEHKALDAAEPGVLLACFQEVRHSSCWTGWPRPADRQPASWL
jgi:hypothetical protein